MNSTTKETTSCMAAPRLISRTMKRLIFCNRRSCCSVCSSRDSNSFARDTALIMPDPAKPKPNSPPSRLSLRPFILILHRVGGRTRAASKKNVGHTRAKEAFLIWILELWSGCRTAPGGTPTRPAHRCTGGITMIAAKSPPTAVSGFTAAIEKQIP